MRSVINVQIACSDSRHGLTINCFGVENPLSIASKPSLLLLLPFARRGAGAAYRLSNVLTFIHVLQHNLFLAHPAPSHYLWFKWFRFGRWLRFTEWYEIGSQQDVHFPWANSISRDIIKRSLLSPLTGNLVATSPCRREVGVGGVGDWSPPEPDNRDRVPNNDRENIINM